MYLVRHTLHEKTRHSRIKLLEHRIFVFQLRARFRARPEYIHTYQALKRGDNEGNGAKPTSGSWVVNVVQHATFNNFNKPTHSTHQPSTSSSQPPTSASNCYFNMLTFRFNKRRDYHWLVLCFFFNLRSIKLAGRTDVCLYLEYCLHTSDISSIPAHTVYTNLLQIFQGR